MKLQINITKEIIAASRFCQTGDVLNTYQANEAAVGQNCAIGKAIFDLFGHMSWVGGTEIFFRQAGLSYIIMSDIPTDEDELRLNVLKIDLPIEAVEFVNQFDLMNPSQRLLLQPFSFTIDVPDEVISWIGIEEATEIINESASLDLV